MKRFILAVFFCTSLLGAFSSFLFHSARAAENPLLTLLNLPAPPPTNPQITLQSNAHDQNFFDKDNPPPDDEPIESLMAYWRTQAQRYNDLQYKVYPSAKVLDRLQREIEKDPLKLGDFLNIFPRTEASGKYVKEFYDRFASGTAEEREQRKQLRRWLKYHTPYFSTELASEAGRVSDLGDYVTNHDALIALARVDWDRASSIVGRLYNDPVQKASRAAALWALYVHAMESGSPSDTDRYRDELKETVADKSLGAGVRDLALDALSLEKEWSGRDEWYLSMMEDETLTDLGRFTGLTTLIANSPNGKYIERMIALLDSENISVRSAAAQNLLDRIETNQEVVAKALIRWLENPRWLKQTARSGRQTVVRSLINVKIPESVPGLIAALDEKEPRPTIPRYLSNVNTSANAIQQDTEMTNAATRSSIQSERPFARMANSANTAVNAGVAWTEEYNLRQPAVEALAFQKDPRAVPALRRILHEGANPYLNGHIVRAILECGGFTVQEQLAAVEKVAKESSEDAEANDLTLPSGGAAHANAAGVDVDIDDMSGDGLSSNIYKDGVPLDTVKLLGIILVERRDVEDGLVRAVIDRIERSEKSDPTFAAVLRKILMRWEGPAINSMLLRDLKNNKVDAGAIVRLLSARKELREKQASELSGLRTGSAIAVGISSCLLEDANDYEAMLESGSDATRTAFLACARLIRAHLPIRSVAANLPSKDKLLALAAERYLESEDSPDARRIVLSLHAGEAKILGATTAFFPVQPGDLSNQFLLPLFASVSPYYSQENSFVGEYPEPDIGEIEKRAQEEVKRTADLIGIYSWEKYSIRIYKDRTLLSWEDDPARYRERVLTKDEFNNFKGLLSHYKAEELPPFLSCTSGEDCRSRELLMIGPNGGRRVFVRSASTPPLFDELDKIFNEMSRPASVIKYYAAKGVPGLQLLFADDRLDAKAVWKSGGDFRLLTADKVRRNEIDTELEIFSDNLPDDDPSVNEYVEDVRVSQERSKREYENFSWNNFLNGAIGSAVTQPDQVGFIPAKDGLDVPPSDQQWKTRAGATEIRADEKGLYKVVAGKLTKIKSGYYATPVITPNGRWVVATKYDEELGVQLVRLNLITNKQFVVGPNELQSDRAIAFVPSFGRILVGPSDEEGSYDVEEGTKVGDESGTYSLMDPETGSVIPVRGEVGPIVQQTFRPLQRATNPFEFWAAIPKTDETVVGLYNARTFTLRPLLKLSKIGFDSMDMWVDEAEGKIYFVYQGQLLSAPIKTK